MVAVPLETPLTNPLAETVATAGLDEVHGLELFGVPDPVSCEVPPVQIVRFPLIVGELTASRE